MLFPERFQKVLSNKNLSAPPPTPPLKTSPLRRALWSAAGNRPQPRRRIGYHRPHRHGADGLTGDCDEWLRHSTVVFALTVPTARTIVSLVYQCALQTLFGRNRRPFGCFLLSTFYGIKRLMYLHFFKSRFPQHLQDSVWNRMPHVIPSTFLRWSASLEYSIKSSASRSDSWAENIFRIAGADVCADAHKRGKYCTYVFPRVCITPFVFLSVKPRFHTKQCLSP